MAFTLWFSTWKIYLTLILNYFKATLLNNFGKKIWNTVFGITFGNNNFGTLNSKNVLNFNITMISYCFFVLVNNKKRSMFSTSSLDPLTLEFVWLTVSCCFRTITNSYRLKKPTWSVGVDNFSS